VNTAANNKPDKTTEFFTKMSSELQGQPEWKDWFGTFFFQDLMELYNKEFTAQKYCKILSTKK
jgi:hypothetical protein